MVKSRWQGLCNKLGSSKHTQPQRIGNLWVNVLRNNIYRRQDAETVNIASDILSIASVSTKQLADIRSGHRLSLSGSIVCLSKKLIVLTLRPKKQLTNTQLCSKLPFTLWQLVNED